MKILIVSTSADSLTPDHPTGLWLEEFVIPYLALAEAGASITVASPKGGGVPLDPKTAPNEKQCEEWASALDALQHTVRIDDLRSDDFDAVFVPGGHGPMIDLVNDAALQRLLADFDRSHKPIAAVCHGPAALLNVRNERGGFILDGRKATGFTNLEERMVFLHDKVPFLLEDAMKDRGAKFESALLPMIAHVVQDGHLITGQNPGSSSKVADQLLSTLLEAPVS